MADEDGYIGKNIGNYRLIEKLACGTFGCVYRGEHAILSNRIVAIKLIHGEYLASQIERDSFTQKARLLEKLKHPHILPIIDIGFHEGFPYMVTEYAPKGSLRDRLQGHSQKPLTEEEAIIIITQIGQALQHAHQQKIVHRDLKPENILFNAKGEALLADFGIAVILATAGTKDFGLGGTPAYMAPEQFEGTISTKSDQYALGCIAYELVTGRKPFIVPSPSIAAMWYQHARVEPIPPAQLNPKLSMQIDHAVLKAMAKQRTDRYVDVFAFIAALQKSSEQWSDEGWAFFGLGRYEEALVAFEQAIRLDPKNTLAYYRKRSTLYNLKRFEEELVVDEQIIRLDPNDKLTYYNKAEALKDLKRYKDALATYEQIIRLDPSDVSAYISKGHTLRNLERFEEALEVYDKAIHLDPSNGLAYQGKGAVLEQLGSLDEAQIFYAKAKRLGYLF